MDQTISSERRVRWGARLVLYPLLLGLIALAWHERQGPSIHIHVQMVPAGAGRSALDAIATRVHGHLPDRTWYDLGHGAYVIRNATTNAVGWSRSPRSVVLRMTGSAFDLSPVNAADTRGMLGTDEQAIPVHASPADIQAFTNRWRVRARDSLFTP
jgi:hypothetical protein